MVVTVLDAAGSDAVRFELTGLTTEQALICAEVYRRGEQWKVRAVGQGYDNGLAGIAAEFGVDVDEPTVADAPAQPAPVPPPVQAEPVRGPDRPGQTGPGTAGPVNLDKGRVSLTKNQTVSLVKTGAPPLTLVSMGLGWDAARHGRSIDLDASVIAFDARGKDVDLVWFMSKQGCRGAIRHSGDNRTGAGEGDDEVITVDLSKVPDNVTVLVFTVNSFSGQTFSAVTAAYCRLLNGAGPASLELVRYDLTEAPRSTGVLMCKLTRQPTGTWNMTALGQFHDGKTVRAMVKPARTVL